jgi:hypothetical protein
MPKKKSSLMVFFLDIGTVGSPNWAPLGKGVSQLPLAYNPQVTTETYVTEDNATSSIDSYQVNTGLSITLWDAVSAPAHAYIENLRKTRAVGSNAECQVLEVDISGSSPYPATLNNAVLAIDNFNLEGGKPQQLGTTLYFNGDPTQGTCTIANGVPAFTATGVTALSMSSIVPAANATAVAVGSSIAITFSNKIKGENIVLMTSTGTVVAVNRSWNAAGTVLTLTPASNMGAATIHFVVLSGVVDIYGQQLANATSKFTTA